MPGVGKVNEYILKGLEITVCGDVIQSGNFENACKIFINFSEAAFDSLYKTCSGLASDTHESTQKRIVGVAQSIVLTNVPKIIIESLDTMCEELEQVCIQNRVSGKTLTLEVKNEKFKSQLK